MAPSHSEMVWKKWGRTHTRHYRQVRYFSRKATGTRVHMLSGTPSRVPGTKLHVCTASSAD